MGFFPFPFVFGNLKTFPSHDLVIQCFGRFGCVRLVILRSG